MPATWIWIESNNQKTTEKYFVTNKRAPCAMFTEVYSQCDGFTVPPFTFYMKGMSKARKKKQNKELILSCICAWGKKMGAWCPGSSFLSKRSCHRSQSASNLCEVRSLGWLGWPALLHKRSPLGITGFRDWRPQGIAHYPTCWQDNQTR